MSDPAIEAKRRAGTNEDGVEEGRILFDTSEDYAEEAAREALEPIRDVVPLLDKLVAIFDQIVMDTPKENELHRQAMNNLRFAVERIKKSSFTSEELEAGK